MTRGRTDRMALFNRKKPRDTSALHAALTRGTLDHFETVYEPAWVHYRYEHDTLLTLALTNADSPSRVAICNRLLDDGADVREATPLHRFLARNQHDFTAEAPLLQRLLDAGADVNEVDSKVGTRWRPSRGSSSSATSSSVRSTTSSLLAPTSTSCR